MPNGALLNSQVEIIVLRHYDPLPTLANGDVEEALSDDRGRLLTNATTVPGMPGSQWLTKFTTALASKLIVSTTEATIRSVTGRIDSTAASGTYYLQLWNLADVPANATVVTVNNVLMAPLKIVHTLGTDDEFNVDFDDGGTLGFALTFGLSSTEFSQTAAGAFLSLTASYVPSP